MSRKNSKDKDASDPSTTSFAWDSMAPRWNMIDHLLGGTEAMRRAGEIFLPRHAEEDSENYFERLETNTLFNMFELTLDTLVGKPFSDPVQLNDDVPDQIKQYEDDVDLQGNNLTTFCRNWFREALAKSFAHVLIDFPSISDEDRIGRTLATDTEENRRPYWVLIKPENVIFASSVVVAGREVLEHVRIAEDIVVREGFTEKVIPQIRILEPNFFSVWQFIRPSKTSTKGEWVLVEMGNTDLNFIPLVTFYADREGLMLGKPPLEDLAFLNVRHWQSTSDQINILTVSRFPMLAVAGGTDNTGMSMAIGPRQLLGTKDPNGRFYYVENEGSSISAGRQDLFDLEAQMSAYGAQFLKQRPGNRTATERVLDSSESSNSLRDMTVRFESAVEQALDVTAEWINLDDGGTVKVRKDFGASNIDPDVLRTLIESRKNRDLSRQDYLQQLKNLQVLNDNFNPRENLMRLIMEATLADIDTSLIDPEDFRGEVEKEEEEEETDDENQGE